jgi:hypothetical protein
VCAGCLALGTVFALRSLRRAERGL